MSIEKGRHLEGEFSGASKCRAHGCTNSVLGTETTKNAAAKGSASDPVCSGIRRKNDSGFCEDRGFGNDSESSVAGEGEARDEAKRAHAAGLSAGRNPRNFSESLAHAMTTMFFWTMTTRIFIFATAGRTLSWTVRAHH
jgi:hypothetical protein